MGIYDISVLRTLGLVVAIVCGVIATRFLRSEREDSITTFFLLGTSISIALVVLFPAITSVLNEILAIGRFQGSRIITLLIIVVIVLWLFSISTYSSISKLNRQVDDFIRLQAGERFFSEHHLDLSNAVMCAVPALNEARNLEQLLPRFPRKVCGKTVHVLVIDDGSEDDTADVVRSAGQFVVQTMVNRGGGSALRTAFDIGIRSGAEVIVTLDADGQNDPEAIGTLVEPVVKGHADVVIGSRIKGEHEITHWWRHAGVVLFSHLINILMGTHITDCSSGYRAIKTSKLATLQLFQDQYHTSELLILAAKKGLKITEVPIVFRRRTSGRSKKGSELLYGFRFCRVLVFTWLRNK